MEITMVMAIVGTVIIACIVKATIGQRLTPDVEREGLDIDEYGKEGYILE
jgi:ammonium transporter, Amt family